MSLRETLRESLPAILWAVGTLYALAFLYQLWRGF